MELTLVNPKTSSMSHNVDFHAATGALGSAGLTLVAPGEDVVVRWKAIKPGVFVYHCAPGGTMIPVSRHLGHERRHHGIAARRPEGCQGQAGAL